MKQVDSLLQAWLRHRDALVALVDVTPEGNQNFTPWEGAWTYALLTLHIVGMGEWFMQAVASGEMANPEPPVQVTSMQQLKEIVHEVTKRTTDTFKALPDEQLSAEINSSKIFGANLTGAQIIEAMFEHEIHHKGQLFVYARMCGVENPPFFFNRG